MLSPYRWRASIGGAEARAFSGLSWCPQGNELALIDVEGQLMLWRNAVPKGMFGPTGNAVAEMLADVSMLDDDLSDFELDAPAEAADDEDDGFTVPSRKKKSTAAQEIDFSSDDDELAAIDLSQDRVTKPKVAQEQNTPHLSKQTSRLRIAEAADATDDDVMDVDSGDDSDAVVAPRRRRADVVYRERARPEDAMQPALQPGSTPMVDGDGERAEARILAMDAAVSVMWRQEPTQGVIDVEFVDRTRKPFRHFDPRGVTMAALGARGLAMAGPADSDVPSFVQYRAFQGSGIESQFLVELPAGEDVVAVAIGTGLVAAATSGGALHFMTTTGVQLGVVSLPGAVVALAARDSTLAVVYHAGLPVGETQTLAYETFGTLRSSMHAPWATDT